MGTELVRDRSKQLVLLAIRDLKNFKLAALAQVTSNLQKSAQGAGFIPECGQDNAGPELRSIFSDSPAFIRAPAVLCCGTKHRGGPVALPGFRRVENRIVFTSGLFPLVSLDPFSSSIPAYDTPIGAETENSIILYAGDERVEVLTAFQQGAGSVALWYDVLRVVILHSDCIPWASKKWTTTKVVYGKGNLRSVMTFPSGHLFPGSTFAKAGTSIPRAR